MISWQILNRTKKSYNGILHELFSCVPKERVKRFRKNIEKISPYKIGSIFLIKLRSASKILQWIGIQYVAIRNYIFVVTKISAQKIIEKH